MLGGKSSGQPSQLAQKQHLHLFKALNRQHPPKSFGYKVALGLQAGALREKFPIYPKPGGKSEWDHGAVTLQRFHTATLSIRLVLLGSSNTPQPCL